VLVVVVDDDDVQHELQFQIENHDLFLIFVDDRNPNYHPSSFSVLLNGVFHARRYSSTMLKNEKKNKNFTSRNNKATKTPFIFCEDSNCINIP
jgi:hypothetical protein